MKQAPSPESVARVVRWAVLFFIAYALWSGMFHKGLQQPVSPVAHLGGAPVAANKDCATQASPFENFSSVASVLLPTWYPSVRVEEIKQGEGSGAVCGQRATLRYQYATDNGKVIYSGMDKDATVTLGGGGLLRGMDNGLLNMKPGGERRINFPAALAFEHLENLNALHGGDAFNTKLDDLRKSVVHAQASLSKLSPALPDGSMPLRIIEQRFSNKSRIQCGDTVRAQVALWKLDGTKLFTTRDKKLPITFTIGKSQLPFGLEQAMLGMGEGSQRTAIIPPSYTQPLVDSDENALGGLKLPEEIILAEIFIDEVGDNLPPIRTPEPPEPPAASHDAAPDAGSHSK